MKPIELELQAVTPLLVGDWCKKARCFDRNSKDAKRGNTLRPSEIKASCRELFRNVAHQLLENWIEVLRIEEILFGSANQASPFKIRVERGESELNSEFHSNWKEAYTEFVEKVKKTKNQKGTKMFYYLDPANYDLYVLEGTNYSVKLIPRSLTLLRISHKFGVDEDTIGKLYAKSISYSMELLGVGKRRSRGMGRLTSTENAYKLNLNGGEFLEDYIEIVEEVIEHKRPEPPRGLRFEKIGETSKKSEVLYEVYSCAKGYHSRDEHRGSICTKNSFLTVIPRNHSNDKYVVGVLLGFHLFRRRAN